MKWPSIADRIAFYLFRRLTAQGVLVTEATALAMQLRKEVRKTPSVRELTIVRIRDRLGEPHALVVREVPPIGACVLWRIDVAGLRRLAEREALAEQAAAREPYGAGMMVTKSSGAHHYHGVH